MKENISSALPVKSPSLDFEKEVRRFSGIQLLSSLAGKQSYIPSNMKTASSETVSLSR
ncbi:hypothetical protein [Salinivibrio costicola]|uniref:hypothetical protein n=1 Tax=Salinivibrio costicola TaxID=51367 RepID=UPI000AD30169|nr:hypothetical protein [Salinivibrio costicola]